MTFFNAVFFVHCLTLFTAIVLSLILQVASKVKQIFVGFQRKDQQHSEESREAARVICAIDKGTVTIITVDIPGMFLDR